MNTCSTLPA